MMSPYIYITSAFMMLIVIEAIVTVVRKKNYYRFNDAITSLSVGMIFLLRQQVINLSVYAYIFHNFAFFSLNQNSFWVWGAAFILQDFCYYWFHRYNHEINILWATHSVHHQSEEFNFTTALRTPSLGFYFTWIFYAPMALLGFHPYMFAIASLVNLFYQFWIHTRHIGKLGWFDRHFSSPSNHKVHHAKNKKYLDKNYGGVLMWWDRIFGTYQAEVSANDYQELKFGTLTPVRSWNPIWVNIHLYVLLFKDALKTKNLADKFTLWFKKTGYRPKDTSDSTTKMDIIGYQNYDTNVNKFHKVYIAFQLLLLFVLSNILLANYNIIPPCQSVYWFVVLSMNLTFIALALEVDRKILKYEIIRFVLSLMSVFIACVIWPQLPLSIIIWNTLFIWVATSLSSLAVIKIHRTKFNLKKAVGRIKP